MGVEELKSFSFGESKYTVEDVVKTPGKEEALIGLTKEPHLEVTRWADPGDRLSTQGKGIFFSFNSDTLVENALGEKSSLYAVGVGCYPTTPPIRADKVAFINGVAVHIGDDFDQLPFLRLKIEWYSDRILIMDRKMGGL